MISPRFFSRRWPSWELNGIVQRHLGSDREILLPIWLDISAAEIRRESPALSDIVALKASAGVAVVADQIVSVTGGISVTVQSLADDDLVDRFLRMIGKLAGVDGKSVLWIAAVDDDLLYHVATIGFELRHADRAIPLKSSVSGYAVRERKQITLNADIESDDRFLTIDRIQSLATAPLFGINGDVFAVVSVASTARRVFSQAGDEQYFTTAAALAGPMLQPLVSARLATLKARRGA